MNYTIHKKNGKKIKEFRFIKEDENKVIGILNNREQVEIDKIEILKISKISTGKTIAIISAGVVLFITTVFVINK